MTPDEFRARYALLQQVAEGGVRSFHAATPAGGAAMVHFIDGGATPENRALLAALERLEPERRARVREVTAVDGSIAVVTDPLPGFRTLADWLQAGPPDPAAPPAPGGAAGEAPGRGEFTRLFLAANPGGAPAPAAGEGEPGEFTRLFRAAAGTADAAGASPAVAPEPAAPAPAPPPPGAPGRGELSELFQRLDLPASALSSPDADAPPAPPAPEPPRFERGPEPAPAPDDDYLDRLYATPAPRDPEGSPPPPPGDGPGALLPPLPPPFVVGAPVPFAPPATPPPPAHPSPPPGPATRLLAGLALTLVLALALVLYFVLR